MVWWYWYELPLGPGHYQQEEEAIFWSSAIFLEGLGKYSQLSSPSPKSSPPRPNPNPKTKAVQNPKDQFGLELYTKIT